MSFMFSIFIPVRSGSSRVKRKNTRSFLDSGESLFQLKMKQVVGLAGRSDIEEVVVSTNDEEIVKQLQPFLSDKVKLDMRPEALCLSTTKVLDLINHVPNVVLGGHVFWLHVTSPFVDELDYVDAISRYKSEVVMGVKDSLMSVNKIQQFIWDDERARVINVDRDVNPWPNTQDLVPLYEVNHAFYISSIDNYLKYNDRIGRSPGLYVCDGVKKMDVDWEDDFVMAQEIARGLKRV